MVFSFYCYGCFLWLFSSGFGGMHPMKNQTDGDVCLKKVIEILMSSSEYKNYIKHIEKAQKTDKTLQYGIEILNDPKEEENGENYRFRINEKHTDYNHSLAWFEFDPQKGTLYEYKVAEDCLLKITVDKKRLNEFYKVCN